MWQEDGRVDKAEFARQADDVRALLLKWDPIGVLDKPEAADEYDCMIGPLLRLLRDGADANTLHGWIAKERTGHFGLDPNNCGDRALAETLAAYWADRTDDRS